MARGDISIHPKFGVNPTMPVCRWCGKETGEIALLGAAYKGEAPRNMVLDDNPCQKCQDFMKQGLTIVEMPDGDTGGKIKDRTGRWCVMKWEGAEAMFSDDFLASVRPKGMTLVHKATADLLKLFDEDIPDFPPEVISEKDRT